MRKILVPMDFSDDASFALEHALVWARAFDSEIHLVNVQVPHGPTSPLLDEHPGEAEDRVALMGMDLGSVESNRVMLRGVSVATTLLSYAEEAGVDMIAMGTHGRRGVPRLIRGSVTEEVLRSSPCPVLTTHAGQPAPSERYRSILVPVDFSPLTNVQFAMATDLARRFSAELEVVHVIDPPTMPDFYVPAGRFLMDMQQVTDTVYGRLESLVAPVESGIEISLKILTGRAVKEVAKRSAHVDLVVVPTHGHTGLDRALLGSVAEGIIRRSKRPVLVIPAQAEHVELHDVADFTGALA